MMHSWKLIAGIGVALAIVAGGIWLLVAWSSSKGLPEGGSIGETPRTTEEKAKTLERLSLTGVSGTSSPTSADVKMGVLHQITSSGNASSTASTKSESGKSDAEKLDTLRSLQSN